MSKRCQCQNIFSGNIQSPASISERIYKALSDLLPAFTMISLAIAVCLDLSSEPYCSPKVEAFFSCSAASPYVSTTPVIWTFGASLLIYFMGKMSDRCFGLHFHETLLAQQSSSKLIWRFALFVVEIFALEVFASCQLPISLFVVSMLQFLNICFILLMVMVETSQKKVISTIEKQNDIVFERLKKCAEEKRTEEGPGHISGSQMKALENSIKEGNENWLLIKVLRGINYQRFEDMEHLLDCLSHHHWDIIKDYPELQILLSWRFGCMMLESCAAESQAEIPMALGKLLNEIASNQDYSLEMKEGLLATLLIRGETWDCNEKTWDMLNRMPDSDKGAALDWSCNFLQELVDRKICGWKTSFQLRLEACDVACGCAESHLLDPEKRKLLLAFLDYLYGAAESKEEKVVAAGRV